MTLYFLLTYCKQFLIVPYIVLYIYKLILAQFCLMSLSKLPSTLSHHDCAKKLHENLN